MYLQYFTSASGTSPPGSSSGSIDLHINWGTRQSLHHRTWETDLAALTVSPLLKGIRSYACPTPLALLHRLTYVWDQQWGFDWSPAWSDTGGDEGPTRRKASFNPSHLIHEGFTRGFDDCVIDSLVVCVLMRLPDALSKLGNSSGSGQSIILYYTVFADWMRLPR